MSNRNSNYGIRKTMDKRSQMSIPGYVPPTNYTRASKSAYKNYGSGNNIYVNQESNGGYKTSNNYNTIHNCPQCYEYAVQVCDCEYQDKTCPNGHSWYIKKNRLVEKSPHQNIH